MLVFLALCIAGMLFFAVSLIFGGDADHGDFDHSGFDHVDVGHSDVGHADHGDSDHHESQGPSIFSIRSFFLFMTGFGAAGAVAKYFGYDNFIASGWGASTGIIFAILGWLVFRVIHKQQASTTTNTASLVGRTGRVTVQIVPGEVGQISTRNQFGAALYLRAKTNGQQTITEGAIVTIQDAVGDIVTVA